MKQKLMHNPYLVMWSYTHEKWEEVKDWVKNNMTSKYQFLATGRGAVMVECSEEGDLVGYEVNADRDGWWKQEDELVALALFECPKDALMFKLTWAG